jgi:hypothetical protein
MKRTIQREQVDAEANRIRLLQYENLRKCFNALLESALGENYYNEGVDVYVCDNFSCRDLAKKIGKECYRQYNSIIKQSEV